MPWAPTLGLCVHCTKHLAKLTSGTSPVLILVIRGAIWPGPKALNLLVISPPYTGGRHFTKFIWAEVSHLKEL